jgi:membrane-associated phospholipid phosphatase
LGRRAEEAAERDGHSGAAGSARPDEGEDDEGDAEGDQGRGRLQKKPEKMAGHTAGFVEGRFFRMAEGDEDGKEDEGAQKEGAEELRRSTGFHGSGFYARLAAASTGVRVRRPAPVNAVRGYGIVCRRFGVSGLHEKPMDLLKVKPRPAIWLGALFFTIFAAVAAAVLARHDLALARWAQSLPRAHDNYTLWWFVENFGEIPTWTVVSLAAVFFALSYRIGRWRRFRPALAFVLLTELIGPGLFNLVLKYTINRPRPGNGLGFFPLFAIGPDRTDNGFPSGHTASAFVLLALAYLVPRSKPVLRRLAAGFFMAWGLAVAVSRVIWGVHYPTDVLFGALITIAVEWLLWTAWFRERVEAAAADP